MCVSWFSVSARVVDSLCGARQAWFGLLIEFGGFDELLRLLHRMFLQRTDVYRSQCALLTCVCSLHSNSLLIVRAGLVPALQIFQVIFDAVWKTVLTTHSSVTLLLLHMDSADAAVAEIVLGIVLEISRIPDAGAAVLLKALSMRKKIVGDSAPRLAPLYRWASPIGMPPHRLLVLRIINGVLDQTPVKVSTRTCVRARFYLSVCLFVCLQH